MRNKRLPHIALAALCVFASDALAQTHTHGSMVGALGTSSVVIWTRSSGPAKVSAIINTTPSVVNSVETAAVLVGSSNDYTAHIQVTGLNAGSKYYYATRVSHPTIPANNTVGAFGVFTTLPLPTTAAKFAFLTSADVHYHNEYGIFDKMRSHEAHLFASLGDMPYADLGLAKTQVQYWNEHKKVRNHNSWFEFIKRFPVEAIWDDHEVINDWDARTSTTLVALGTKAFRDYYPLPPGTFDIYRSLRWGSGAELFLLDCRFYRGDNRAPASSLKTMLGNSQKAWLKSALKASTATFKIIVSSVPFGFCRENLDDWSGYLHEREEIFAFIQQNQIKNVVLLSSDAHVMSVHHHRAGFREFVMGPLAQDVHKMVPADAEVRYRASIRNFVYCKVDPTTNPATMVVEYYDADDKLVYSETLKAEKRATAKFIAGEPDGGFRMKGPLYFRNRGNDVVIPCVEPGNYSIRFDPQRGSKYHSADITVPVPPGSQVVAAGRWRELRGPTVLLNETFDKPLSGHTIIDEVGATGGPSGWLTNGGMLWQGSRIGGPAGTSDSDRPGTMLILGDSKWQDYTTTVRFKSHERGRIGVIFRYQDKDNYYRFIADDERPLRRLEKKVKGLFTTLKEEQNPYLPHNNVDVECVANGSTIKVAVDGEVIFNVTDTTFSAGKVGLYVWQNILTEFEDISVTTGDRLKPLANKVFADDFNDSTITGWTIKDLASVTGPSMWRETIGALMQLNSVGDDVTGNPLAKPGTLCLVKATTPADMQFAVNMVNFDVNGMGVVFRYKGPSDHYRFYWNQKLRTRQLQKVVNGTWSVLWGDTRDFSVSQWYRVRVSAVGSRLRLYVDDELLADVTDSSHSTGSVGLYCWKCAGILFENFQLQTPNTELPILVSVTDKLVTKLHGRAPESYGLDYGLALSFAKTPAIPLTYIDPKDARYLELRFDFLMELSLVPSPLFVNFFGKLDMNGQMMAQINWPNLPSLKGTKIYAGGWTGNIIKNPVKDVFPTVEIIYP